MIPCEKVSSLPQVTLKLGGKDYTLSPEDYTLKVSGARGVQAPWGAARAAASGDRCCWHRCRRPGRPCA